MSAEPTGGSIKVTPARALAVAALFGALGGWLIVISANALDLVAPQVPWSTPVVLVLITILVGVLAYATHVRIQLRRERIEPERGVAFLVLGKAAALGGAVVSGGYLAFGLLFVQRFDAELPRDRVIRSAVTVAVGIAMSLAGIRLERACKVPGSEDDEDAEPPA